MVLGIQDDDGSFQQETVNEIEQRFIDRAKDELGEDIDLSQGSPLKQLIDVVILEDEYIWQLLEDVYYSAYYGHAYEEQLDKLMALTQFSRIPRRGATGEVTFTVQTANQEDVIIPEGTRVATYETEDRPSIPFKTEETVRFPAGAGSVSNVPVRACEPWETDLDEEWLGAETNVAAGTIEKFQTPVSGIDHVTNPNPTGDQSLEKGYSYIEGRDRETDEEFRNRYESEMASNATASLDALADSVDAIDWVRNTDIEENVTMTDNRSSGGLPEKSFRLTVLGDGPADEIAQKIVETRSAGIESYGDSSGVGTTIDGTLREESFDWANEVPIYVNVTVTHDSEFPSDGSLRVENNIIEYIGGEKANGDTVNGLGMGDDVVYDMIFKEAMDVQGVWSVDLSIGKSSDGLGTNDLGIFGSDTAMSASADINVFTEYKETT